MTNNIKKIMKAKNVSLSALSVATGIPKSTLYHIENQAVINTSIENAYKIARFLGVTMDDLIFE